jgi:alpha-L-rhamnosidase
MNSLNHYAYGSIIEWCYRNAAGIQPIEEYPGFRKFRLAPQPDASLGACRAQFRSPLGTIISSWRVNDDGSLSFKFVVPFGATALLTLPDADDTEYTGEILLESGEHTFNYVPSRPYKAHFGLNTPIAELLRSPVASAVLDEELSDLTEYMLFTMFAGEASVEDLIKQSAILLNEDVKERLALRFSDIKP